MVPGILGRGEMWCWVTVGGRGSLGAWKETGEGRVVGSLRVWVDGDK